MLAIIIPYYKLAFFEDTLQSLSNQADKRFKVYIGDDASPEDCTGLLEKFQGKFDFIYHRFETNLGSTSLVKQWERCIAMSSDEEWLMILGDDDLLDDSVVSSWYENYAMFNGKSKLVRFATQLIFQELKTVSDVYTHPVWENASDSFFRKYENLTRSSLSEYIFSREAYLKYCFYDYPLAWNSDDRAWLDFSDHKPIFTINESVVFVRISDQNISGKQDNVSVKNLSVIKFYKFIILRKLEFYSKKQRERLLRRYEDEIRNVRNLKLSECFLLFFLYLKYFEHNAFKKFCKRVLKSKLKRYDS